MEPEEGTPLWRLQKLPAELGPKLLHKIIDGICGRTYPLYQDYQTVWDATEWMQVLKDITNFFRAVVGKNLSDEEISQQLNQLHSFHQEAIMKCLKSRKDDIKQALLGEIVDISSAQLQDFDWQLKLALSSDKIATLQTPLLNLHLDIKENGEVKPYSVEMSKEELQNLINSLEAANKSKGEEIRALTSQALHVVKILAAHRLKIATLEPCPPAIEITGKDEYDIIRFHSHS